MKASPVTMRPKRTGCSLVRACSRCGRNGASSLSPAQRMPIFRYMVVRFRCDFHPLYRRPPALSTAFRAKKSALRQNVHPPGFPAHRWMNGGGQGCVSRPAYPLPAVEPDRRSQCIGMKQICAAPYESVLKLCSVEGQATYSPYRVSAFCRPLGRPPCAFLSAIPLRSGTHKRVTVFAVLVLWPAGGRLCGENSKKCGCKFARFML